MNDVELTFTAHDVDFDQFKNFLNVTPPMVEDLVANVSIDPEVPTWIFYPEAGNGKIEQDDVTILTFHEGAFEAEDEGFEDVVCEPLAEGTYNGKVGYWELEMRGSLLPEFVFNNDCWH